MLGVDFDRTQEAQYAFEQTAAVRNHRYTKEERMLNLVKPYFEKDGFEVFNCNPESKSEAFPFVPFDEAFQDCKGGVPDEPFDLADWYGKGVKKQHKELQPESVNLEWIRDMEIKRRKANLS